MEALNVGMKVAGVLHPPFLRMRATRQLSCCHPCKWPVDTANFHGFRYIQTRAHLSEKSSPGSPVRAVPVQVAHELLNAGHRYLDVRTAEEFALGHIEGGVNIPYMYKAGSGLAKNLRFLEDVGEKFGKDDEVVVGCQMGKRSQMAAGELVAAGFTGITDMAGGYMAWVQSGMPTKATV